jgi:hypothetical protein
MTKSGKFLTSMAAALLMLAVARADTIETFTHTTTASTVPFTDSFLLPGFDTSLGTLEDITITLDADGTAEVDVINVTAIPQAFTHATATIPVSLTGPGPTTTSVTLSAGPTSGTAAPGLNSFPGLPASATNTVDVSPADFGMYEGLGLIVSVDVAAGTGTYGGTSNPGVFFGGSSTAGAVTTISYDYMPGSTTHVPEPATVSLFGVALLGIGRLLKKATRSGKRA